MTTGARHYPLEQYSGEIPPSPDWFRQALAHEPDRRCIVVDGTEIEALSWGVRGDPGVLLLHGAMANADWWGHMGPQLSQGRRVTAISISGMGKSGWRDAYSVDIHAREALEAAEATGLFDADRAPIVVAHSFGGHILLRLAAHRGDLFERGVILDSMAGAPSHPPRHVINTGRFDTVAEALARFRLLPGQAAEPFILDWFGRQGLKLVASDAGTGRYAWSFDPEFFVKFAPVADGPDLAAARCPLVFVRGQNSGVCTEDVETLQRAAAPSGSRFLTIQDAAHHIMADQPLRLSETLSRLLTEHSAALHPDHPPQLYPERQT